MMIQAEQEILSLINQEVEKHRDEIDRKCDPDTGEHLWCQNEGDVKDMCARVELTVDKALTQVLLKLHEKGYIRQFDFGGLMITQVGYRDIGQWTL